MNPGRRIGPDPAMSTPTEPATPRPPHPRWRTRLMRIARTLAIIYLAVAAP